MNRTAVGAMGAIAVCALALTGCGATEAPVEASEGDGSGGEAITIVDARGEEVVLPDGPAETVVALEWNQAELVVTLGGELTGLSDVDGYTSWVGEAAPLPNEPTDVGVRSEPSIEAVSELEPDLIVGSMRSIPDEAMEQMERIAPVALFTGADAADPLGTVRSDFETMATLLGEEERGAEVLAEMDETLAANATRIEEAGLAGTPIVFASPYADGANVTIRMHGPGSSAQAVAAELGLTAAWDDDGDEGYGLSNTDLEGLTTLPDDTEFLYWDNADEEDVVETSLAGSAVWESLAFVEDGRVHPAAVGIWAYGGPESMMAWSDDIVRILGA
ncbi:iron-siderophore ABC transporter substrate-binding protein [Microbacterium sp. G2-8]|uniref:ABC transporter substrate-binding protein n=1 Tax=Microbacterium sp. G2-8 TaxID=2842454 RepID=UPI001C8A684C|nr:iron-siderophore ABC transporter substrate-binding protein [Microbacterium sp. G2-8]